MGYILMNRDFLSNTIPELLPTKGMFNKVRLKISMVGRERGEQGRNI